MKHKKTVMKVQEDKEKTKKKKNMKTQKEKEKMKKMTSSK